MDLKNISLQTLERSKLTQYQALAAAEIGHLWLEKQVPERLEICEDEELNEKRQAGLLSYACFRVEPHEVPLGLSTFRVRCTLQHPSTGDVMCLHRGVLQAPSTGTVETTEQHAVRFLATVSGLPPVSSIAGLIAWHDLRVRNEKKLAALCENGLGFTTPPLWDCHIDLDMNGLVQGTWRSPHTRGRWASLKRQAPGFLQKLRGGTKYEVQWNSGSDEPTVHIARCLQSAGLAGLDKKELASLRDELPPRIFRQLQDLVIR